jgi:hypothetical protein
MPGAGLQELGSCEVKGSNGVERRKARVRRYICRVALLVLLTVLFITGPLAQLTGVT